MSTNWFGREAERNRGYGIRHPQLSHFLARLGMPDTIAPIPFPFWNCPTHWHHESGGWHMAFCLPRGSLERFFFVTPSDFNQRNSVRYNASPPYSSVHTTAMFDFSPFPPSQLHEDYEQPSCSTTPCRGACPYANPSKTKKVRAPATLPAKQRHKGPPRSGHRLNATHHTAVQSRSRKSRAPPPLTTPVHALLCTPLAVTSGSSDYPFRCRRVSAWSTSPIWSPGIRANNHMVPQAAAAPI